MSDVLDFRKIDLNDVMLECKANKVTGKVFGKMELNEKPIRVHTPWMRTPSALSKQTNFGVDYFLSLSLHPPNIDESLKEQNGEMLEEFTQFVDKTYEPLVNLAEKEWENWFGETIDKEVLSTLVKSIHTPSDGEFPAKIQLKLTKRIDEEGNFKGKVYEQSYDKEADKFTEGIEEKSISEMKPHARVRLQLLLKSVYVWKNKEDPSKTRLGLNWSVEQILFYNPYDTTVEAEEEVFTSCTFGKGLSFDSTYNNTASKRDRVVVVVENAGEEIVEDEPTSASKRVKVGQ